MDHNLIPLIIQNLYYFVTEYDYKFCKYRNLELHKLLENEECQCASQPHGHIIEKFLSSSQNIFFMSKMISSILFLVVQVFLQPHILMQKFFNIFLPC